MNTYPRTWKAGWVNALAGSNPASSAKLTQPIAGSMIVWNVGTLGVNGALDRPRPSVVLVDDSKEVRALVRRRLELSGLFEVVGEGGDGEEAIGLAHRLEPALMLLDTSMPTMDGIEALPAILALCPETKVVMFTGFEDQGLAARARELGAADFVEKSIQLEELPGRLMRTLNDGPPDAFRQFSTQAECRGRCLRRRATRSRPGAAGPQRAHRAVPGAVRPGGDRDGHPDRERHHRSGQPGTRRAHVVQSLRPRGGRLRPADRWTRGQAGPRARGHQLVR